MLVKPRKTYIEIPMQNSQETALVDPNFQFLSNYKWYLHGGYPRTSIEGKKILMHKIICDAKRGTEVDHINRNKLDNRTANLRAVKRGTNIQNRTVNLETKSSKYQGVYKYKDQRNRPFNAYISFEGKRKSLGYFYTEEQAALAYNKAALELYGEHAYLNPVA